MTDDPDVRIANSVMDYLFRRLALDYLPYDTRSELGIFTAEERTRAVETGSYTETEDVLDAGGVAVSQDVPDSPPNPVVVAEIAAAPPGESLLAQTAIDAPLCMTCGVKMRPAGSCYVCESCGSTSGCS
jgi:ribonucleoside-diphosphate reductase alpha chain